MHYETHTTAKWGVLTTQMPRSKWPRRGTGARPSAADMVAMQLPPPDVDFEWVDDDYVAVSGPKSHAVAKTFGVGGESIVHVDRYTDACEWCAARDMRITAVPFPVMRKMFERRASRGEYAGDYASLRARLPSKMTEKLLPFQWEGIRVGADEMGGRVMLCDDPGLGKTIQSIGIALATFYSRARNSQRRPRILVVAPTAVLGNWVNEVHKWTDLKACAVLSKNYKTATSTRERDASDVWVVSYESTSHGMYPLVCLENEWDAAIVDECHKLQNRDSLVAKNLTMTSNSVLQRTPCVVMVSGTPFSGRTIGLLVATQTIAHHELDYATFSKRYCDAKPALAFGRYEIDDRGKSHVLELEMYLRTMMVRRLANDVLDQLPPKTRVIKYVAMTEAARGTYVEARQKYYDARAQLTRAMGESLASPDNARLTRAAQKARSELQQTKNALWRLCGDLKKEQAFDMFVEELQSLPANEKALAFAHHEVVRSYIASRLDEANIPYVVIDGSTDALERIRLLASVSDPNSPARVGILSITACGAGLNATPGVTLSAFFELHWTPGMHDQAEARAHRIGTTKPQRCVYYVLSGTVEADVLRSHAAKHATTTQCLNGEAETRDFDDSDDESESESDENDDESSNKRQKR